MKLLPSYTRRQQLFKQIHEQSSHSPGTRRPQLSPEASTLSP